MNEWQSFCLSVLFTFSSFQLIEWQSFILCKWELTLFTNKNRLLFYISCIFFELLLKYLQLSNAFCLIHAAIQDFNSIAWFRQILLWISTNGFVCELYDETRWYAVVSGLILNEICLLKSLLLDRTHYTFYRQYKILKKWKKIYIYVYWL